MSRARWSLAALAVMIGLISAGCSNTRPTAAGGVLAAAPNASTSPVPALVSTAVASERSGGSNTNRDQAVKFAECMRANGIRGFPDPDASGALAIDAVANRSGVDTNTAAFKQAMSACKDLEPPGFTGNKRSPEQQQAALKFAQCIRDDGVKDFPDPGPDDPMIDTNRIPSAASSGGMNILHAAMQKCQGLAASAGVTGGQ